MLNSQFLLNAHTLSQSSIEDMKALLITYPFCSLFRVIALLKAKEENHPLEKDWLETSSVYCPDRAYLFQLYRDNKPQLIAEEISITRTQLSPISARFLPSKEEPTPLPKTSFPSWALNKPKPLETTVEPPTPVAEETSQDERVAAGLAAKSVAKDEEIISETLAKVFAKQGKKERAIEIYLKLSLKFPEKKAYFADLIENLDV